MTLPSSDPDELSKKFTRAKFLRNSAITASGIILLPSIFSSCKKFVFEPGTGPGHGYGSGYGAGWGGVPTLADLQSAAANLTRMRAWITDLYPLSIEYEEAVFELLDSTKQNSNWANFIGNIFIDIAVGIAGAVAVASGGSLAMPAFACLAAILKDWGLGKETPPDLAGTFAEFMIGHNKMQYEIEQKLSSLVDPTNNYSNLLAQWNEVIEFNGKSYTLHDLATSAFPGLSDEYNKLQEDAYTTYFKKSLWNLVIIKCCSYYENYHDSFITPNHPAAQFYLLVQNSFYPQNKGVYVRGDISSYNDDGTIDWTLIYYNLGLGGYAFPDKAAAVLFMDDTPGHIINPGGLFNRSYVFQQFSTTKPVFKAHELAGYPNNDGNNFADSDDWNFTGGLFPRLIQ